MPYELTCPSCSLAVTSSFVRVGAVVACARCGQVYRISEAHVRRKAVSSAGVSAAAASDQGLQIPEPSTEELIERATDGQIVGLSGLSEMMRQVPTAGDAGSPPPPAGIIRTATPSKTRGGEAARQGARRRSAQMLYGLLAGFVLFMAALGGGLWYVMMTGGVQTPFNRGSQDDPAGTGAGRTPSDQLPIEPPPYAWLPLLEGTPLPAPRWRPVGKPYEDQYHPSTAWLTDQQRVFTQSAEEHFVASVVTDSKDIAVSATAHLTLVLVDTRTAVAEAAAPVAFFGGGRRDRIRVALPSELGAVGLLSVDGWVEVHETFEGGVYLGVTQAEAIEAPEGFALLVSAVNTSDRPVEHSVFRVTAADAQGRTLARWRVEVDEPAGPGEAVEFRLLLPPPVPDTAQVDDWIVEAAAR